MNRDNHYEPAFEAFLRGRGAAVVPVDETRRSYLEANEVKSPDFIVLGATEGRLVVDVKGRRFPVGSPDRPRKVWEQWTTREDVEALARWARRLGPGFRGVLAFVYELLPSVSLPPGTPDLFTHGDRVYLARGVGVEDYAEHMRTRSPSWDTVDLPADTFRRLVRPFTDFLGAPIPEEMPA
jgi:hypothetical protein